MNIKKIYSETYLKRERIQKYPILILNSYTRLLITIRLDYKYLENYKCKQNCRWYILYYI